MPDILFRAKENVRVGPGASEKDGNDFIIIDATSMENHVSEYEVTRHPVGEGLDIVDHKRARPRRLALECVVSNTPLFSAITEITSFELVDSTVSQAAAAAGSSVFNNKTASRRDVDVWTKLKEYQASNTLMEIYTTLEVYKNMQITRLAVPRDSSRGNALHFAMELEEIRIVASEETEAINVQARPRKRKRPTENTKKKDPKNEKASGSLAKKLKGAVSSFLGS